MKVLSTCPGSSLMRNPQLYAGKVILAPMVRVGTLPMRFLALNLGAGKRRSSLASFNVFIDLVYSPEIVDKSIIGAERRLNDKTGCIDYVKDGKLIFRTHPDEQKKLVFQLGTADPQLALQAALTVQQEVAAFDLNCGCPKRFSLQAGMGAALLRKPETLLSILQELIKGTEKPVSAKIRLFLDDLPSSESLVESIIKTGVSALAIHARDPHERSEKHPAHWNLFLQLAERVRRTNVELYGNQQDQYATLILNGDIGLKEYCSYVPEWSLKRILQESGASAVMSARAAQWNPLVLRQLKRSLTTEEPLDLSHSLESLAEASRLYLNLAFTTANPFHNTKYILLQIWNQVAGKAGGGRDMAVAVQQAKRNSDFVRLFGMQEYCEVDDLDEFEEYLDE